MTILVDPAQSTVTHPTAIKLFARRQPGGMGLRCCRAQLQEGYPTEGVWRVRNIGLQAAQWVFGGGLGHARSNPHY